MEGKIGVRLKIDVTKIDKSKLFKGKKGTYLDATVFINPNKDEYDNNGMITQDAEKNESGNILGNCKVFWEEQGAPQQSAPPAPNMDTPDDDIPF